MSTTEALISYTMKVGPANDLLTARGNSEEEFLKSYEVALRHKARLEGTQHVTQAVTQVIPETPVTLMQAVDNLAAAGITGTVVNSDIEVKEDQWGNRYTKGSPDAGACIHGARMVKRGTNKSGREYRNYVCVNDSPFRVGKYDKNAVCEATWPAR